MGLGFSIVPEDKVKVGDKVVINSEKIFVQKMQQGHGGWVDRMEYCIEEEGEVVSIDDDGDVHIQFKHNKFCYNPCLVAKVLSVGDIVKMTADLEKARFLQHKHGEWIPGMERSLGKTGIVNAVLPDFDVMVAFDEGLCRFNPLLLSVIQKSSGDSSSNSDTDSDSEEKIKVGDKVVINSEKIIVQKMQDIYGEWSDEMKKYIGDEGEVVSIGDNGDVEILFKDDNKFFYKDFLVAKVLSVGNIVKMSADLERVRFLQHNHGEWGGGMNRILGKTGKVCRVLPNFDVKVKFEGRQWRLNPLLCTVIKKSSGDLSCNDDADAEPEYKVKKGDKVVINSEKSIVKKLQDGHGGWNDDMKNYIGKKGKVKFVDGDGDVHIKFSDCTFCYNPAVVAKVLATGDTVKITADVQKAKSMQDNFGGRYPDMENILGRTGKVDEVLSNFDVIVEVDGMKCCLNPLLCIVIKKAKDDSSSDSDSDSEPLELLSHMMKLYEGLSAITGGDDKGNTDFNLGKPDQQNESSSLENPCLLCSEMKQLIKFEPCGHLKVCLDCHSKNKISKCIECKKEITAFTQTHTKEVKNDDGFQPGDKVVINMEEGLFHEQEAKYNPKLKDLLTKIGIVGESEKDGKVLVKFGGKGYRIPPQSLKKVNAMNIEEI